jgi:ABC-type sulfate transport system permease subunit
MMVTQPQLRDAHVRCLVYGGAWDTVSQELRALACICMQTGMALATMFVTLPFVVRELIPILETMDLSQVR